LMALRTTDLTGTTLSKQQMGYTHPTFTTLQPIWQKLRDVRWGSGGFLDGTYLIAHPREYLLTTRTTTVNGVTTTEQVATTRATKKLLKRRELASYENFAHTIVEQLKTALFREQATRRINEQPAPTGDVKGTIWEWW